MAVTATTFAENGSQFATLLTREAFMRKFRDRRALAAHVGLCGAPFASGGLSREQGIGKDGNAISLLR